MASRFDPRYSANLTHLYLEWIKVEKVNVYKKNVYRSVTLEIHILKRCIVKRK